MCILFTVDNIVEVVIGMLLVMMTGAAVMLMMILEVLVLKLVVMADAFACAEVVVLGNIGYCCYCSCC